MIIFSAGTLFLRAVLGLVSVAILGLLCFLGKAIYNVWFHPLRKYPGPKLWAATRIPYAFMIISGQSHKRVLQLHEKYGDVVRIAPDELSYLDPQAWNDVMGHRKRGQGENGKDPIVWKTQQHSVISADRENHGRMRRILSHGFSAQSMADQQPLIKSCVDRLVQRLRANCDGGNRPLNMVSWYNWTTFDVIGDLAFGESFGCLESSDYHPWVRIIFSRIRGSAMHTLARRFPFASGVLEMMIPKKLREDFRLHAQLVRDKVAKRLELGSPRPDFTEAMISRDEKSRLTLPEIHDNSSLLIVAGSEATATTLSGATYLLTTHLDVLAKLTEEVRSSFNSEDEIDLLSVQKLEYMMAVLEESMRIYPPVPTTLPRKAQPGGDIICGRYVPEGTVLGIWQWPLYHSSRNFTTPDAFVPDRWLGDPRFSTDEKKAFQPFSFGPRNCLGKNLAYAEMRLILARIIWNFDLKIADDSRNWLERNEAYILWQKPDLNIYVVPRKFD